MVSRDEPTPAALLATLEVASEGALVVEEDGHVRHANPAMVAIHGGRLEDLVGSPVPMLNADPAAGVAIRAEVIARGRWAGETVLRRTDGATYPARLSVVRLPELGVAVVLVTDLSGERRARAELDLFFERSIDLLCIAGRDGRFRRLNAEWERLLGHSCADLIGRAYLDFVHPDDRERTAAAARVAAGEAVIDFTNRYRAADGSYHWIEWRSFPSGDAIYAVARDVTENRRLATAAREISERLRLVFDQSPVGAALLDLEGRFLSANPALCRFLARDEEELRALRFPELLHPDHRDAALAGVAAVREGRAATHAADERYLRPDGSVVWGHVRVSLLHDESGAPLCLVPIVQDITARKHVEEQLRRREELLASVLAHLPAIVSLTDRAHVVELSEGLGLATIGLRPGQVVGQSALELFADHPTVLTALRCALAGEVVSYSEILAGEHFEATSVPVREADGAVRAVLTVAHNVTARDKAEEERRRLERQLEESARLDSIGILAGGVAHDFNNLLTTIVGQISLLRSDLGPESPIQAGLSAVLQAAESAATLTRQLLTFSRKQIIAPRLIDLAVHLGGLERMLRRLASEKVEVIFDLTPGLGAALVDPAQLEQVIVNLAANARDAMTNGGTLTFALSVVELAAAPTHAAGPYLALDIQDTGVGLSAEVRAHLFEPFFTTKPRGRGTGLGLAMVYGAMRQCGGDVEVTAPPPRGTRFRLLFPRAADAPEELPLPSSSELPGGTETVLLVEDEAAVRDVAVRVLRRLGYTVLVAASAAEAIVLANTTASIDVLFSDVVLPGLDGAKLAATIVLRHPETRVLFTSGHHEDIVAHHGVVDRRTHFLPKPYGPRDLAHKLREILG